MTRRAKLPLPLLALPLLSALSLPGCGGSNEDNGGLVPDGIVRFRDVSSDYNGGSTDLTTTGGSILPAQDYSIFVVQTSNGRTLGVSIPNSNLESRTTVTLDGSVTNARATYNASVDGTTDTYDWISSGGTVRVTSTGSGTTTIRLDAVKFVRNTEAPNGSLGTFTLNGTITATPVQTLSKR